MTADGFKPPSYYAPRRGPSPLVVAALAAAVVVVLAAGLMVALGIGPFAPSQNTQPTAQANVAASDRQTEQPTDQSSLNPSLQPTDAPTNGSTAGPTDSPTAPPTIGPSPGDALGRLLAHVPEPIRSSCSADSFSAPILALVSCTSTDSIAVDYALYPDGAAMYTDYDRIVGRSQIEPDSGNCYDQNADGTLTATSNSWPSERLYAIADEDVGRYLCEPSGQGTVTWSDDRFEILAVATAPSGDLDRLVTFWVNEAGPIE